jgi:hypothetical protein
MELVKKHDIQYYIDTGIKTCNTNPFYNTLYLFLKYYFVKKSNKDFYILDFIKNITTSETEFKVFNIYKNYSLDIYYSVLIKLLSDDNSIDDTVYSIIGYVKLAYDSDKNVIKPYIHSISDNEDEIIKQYNYIKTNYIIKLETVEKFQQLEKAIMYLEEAKKCEEEAKKYEDKAKYFNQLALESLYDVKNHFENSFNIADKEQLFIKN